MIIGEERAQGENVRTVRERERPQRQREREQIKRGIENRELENEAAQGRRRRLSML